jgi:hypothetical protein
MFEKGGFEPPVVNIQQDQLFHHKDQPFHNKDRINKHRPC